MRDDDDYALSRNRREVSTRMAQLREQLDSALFLTKISFVINVLLVAALIALSLLLGAGESQ